MNKNELVRTIVVFVALVLGGIGMVVAAPYTNQAAAQQVFPVVGSAIFGSGLTFFLVQMFAMKRS